MAIQWLLVGGPADGKVVSIVQGGGSVAWHGEDGQRYLYQGQNYLEGGRLYRVGCIDPNDLEPSRVRELIHSTGVQHVAGS